uniref:Gypsy retrotransposon integrase-like protein 1 n=1 Tax=Denticeps clupeoides TaxID=299321 RepID=A0AAY4C672_9TELE
MSEPRESQKGQQTPSKIETAIGKLHRGSVEGRAGAPGITRSAKCETLKTQEAAIPVGLIGPISIVSVRIEDIYAKALLDSGSQVTLLYRSFYDKYLKHMPLTPIDCLEIWGLSVKDYPYEGYLCLKLEFNSDVVGVSETVETLVLVCPDPIIQGEASVIIGTNTSVVRRLFNSCKLKGGENFLCSMTVHPEIKQAYQKFQQSPNETADLGNGTVWLARGNPMFLPPGGTATVTGIPKLHGCHSTPTVLVDSEEGELTVLPTLKKANEMSKRRITFLVRNMSTHAVTLKRGMPIAQLCPVDVVGEAPVITEDSHSSELTSDSFNFKDSPMSEQWREQLCKRMLERKEVFSRDEFDVGCAKNTEHLIRVTDNKPFRERSRRLPPGDVADVRKHLNGLLKAGIISESRSPYASPIVVVRKRNGAIRMCVDYRTLNRRTVPDQYTVPRIEDALTCLNGSQWFSVLDLRSGYYQIPLASSDKEKTAFICPAGFYQFERMPQGISGAPATFQRAMERMVGDMNLLEVLVYLDDLIVFGRTLEEHNERLFKVLDRLKEEGLKLSLDKCKFCCTSVNYLGHIVSREGVGTDSSKVEAVKSWPRPNNISALRSFLGFSGYYRRFVRDYSRICFPLNQLLKGCDTARKTVKKCIQGKDDQKDKYENDSEVKFHPSEPFGHRWNAKCEEAFELLKRCLTEAPVLAFANPHLPYTLHVDASREGLGAVLYQDQENGLRPVAFVSRSLSPSERNYPTHKLEFLALKWAVTDKLHDYLYGGRFEVHTDNNPLTYVLTTAKLDAVGHRWLAALSTYDFSLKYRPGRKNIDADALSRRPHVTNAPSDEWETIPCGSVKALCQVSQVRGRKHFQSARIIDIIGASKQVIPRAYCNVSSVCTHHLPKLNPGEIAKSQQADPCIGEVIKAITEGDVSCADRTKHKDISLLLKEGKRLRLEDSILYRVSKAPEKQAHQQLLLPQEFRGDVLRSLHDNSGHLGFDKTYGLIRERFYWPRMKEEVERYCKNCGRCIQRKTLPTRAAELKHLTSEGPMDLICIDFLSLEPDSKNVCNVLVVTDHYTRYAQAFPTKDQKSSTVAKVLWEKFFIHYGLPRQVHSDQGRDFECHLIHDLLKMLGVKKSRTTPYHPQGDPQPERFNRTLLNMLGTLSTEDKSKWSQHISFLVHAYNCTVNHSTGYSPYFLMFGREARLPVDVCFGLGGGNSSPKSYIYIYIYGIWQTPLSRATYNVLSSYHR